ncbi:MAG: outer membrane beta-barrel protein [Acidobacteriota bacterium]|nr:outer membrane beta-barrel protein [Acidobacteriota bacterium]
MKKFVGVAVLLLFVVVAAYPSQLSFKVSYGVSMIGLNGSDYNKSADSFMKYVNDNYSDVVGDMGKLSFTPVFFQGEMIFSFRPSLGVGFGASYFSASRSDAMSYMALVTDELTYEPKLSAFSIFMNFHYFLPIGSRMKLDIYAGPVLAFGSFSYGYSDAWLLWDYSDTFKAKGTAFGFQTGLGFDIQLASKISLVFDILYRLAPWGNVQGTLTEKGWILLWDVDDVWEDITLWSGHDSDGDWLVFSDTQPTGYDTVKKAKFDLGGLTATFGIKIGLF